jgi:hypothetical protein
MFNIVQQWTVSPIEISAFFFFVVAIFFFIAAAIFENR